jgi:hypothetical protein
MPNEQQPTEVLAEPPLPAPAAPAVEEVPAAPAVEEAPAAPAVEEVPAAPQEAPAATADPAPSEPAAEVPDIAPPYGFQLGELWETGRKLVAAGLEKRGNPHGAELARVGADMMLHVSQVSAQEALPGIVTAWAVEFLGKCAEEYDKRPELAQLLRAKAAVTK